MDQEKVKVDKRAKNNEANFQHIDRTSSVNKGLFIIWPKTFEAFEDFFFTYSFIYSFLQQL